MITLGIESSCDETSIALLNDGNLIRNAVYSQAEHQKFGGVVPEIASRAHVEKIAPLAESVFTEATITPRDLDLIAVTDSPGLAGALLVGVSFAPGLHVRWQTPITGINHLEGHICSVFLEHPSLAFPFIALVVSGGHTALYVVEDVGSYRCLGQTVDDAAGEAYDKVGKMLGFPYPAGREIERESLLADPAHQLSFPIARVGADTLDFSFSGLKTAVKYYIEEHGLDSVKRDRPTVCRAFQETVVASLVNNARAASLKTGIKKVALVGGVACNKRLREAMKDAFGSEVYFPAPIYCGDNAAMIAYAGYLRFQKKLTRMPHMNPGGTLENV